MRVTLSKTTRAEHVYISRAYRDKSGKSTSKIFKKLGTMEDLLKEHDNDREKVLAWAREQARIFTEAERNNTLTVPLEFSEEKQIEIGENVSFNCGYLFLQKIYHDLGLDKVCKTISKKYDF